MIRLLFLLCDVLHSITVFMRSCRRLKGSFFCQQPIQNMNNLPDQEALPPQHATLEWADEKYLVPFCGGRRSQNASSESKWCLPRVMGRAQIRCFSCSLASPKVTQCAVRVRSGDSRGRPFRKLTCPLHPHSSPLPVCSQGLH